MSRHTNGFRNPFRLAGYIPLMLATVLVTGCSEETVSAEEQIRQVFDQVEQAAESRSRDDLMALISEEYEDSGQRTWKDIRAIIQLEFIRNPKIHTFKLVRNLTLQTDTSATATLLVAMAGRPIDNASALSGLRADLMRFDVTLIENDGWKIRSAEWQWAEPGDFL